ncbi:hypothetical protein [Leucobacter aridicollis]|uniref:hypothetical protein n=1 Tax=Leucobacter aridicollis TaxID=283878 RepID=UPI00216991D0|nr:hypothetical protein [Leucobacter aridicollis]MCS3426719.1 multidrug efflux pump subunit AcrA (membrane-fusion protein) [Leucobacter aridicollis]
MTEDPSPEQIEAAAKVIDPHAFARLSVELDDAERESLDMTQATLQRLAREQARAALVAAAGAAPQADSAELAWYKKAAKHSADSMAEARATLQQLADRVDQFLFDELASVLDDQPLHYETGDVIGEAAQVQVDEAKLAEVIWEEQSSRVLDGYVIHTRATAATTAAAVAEWLRGSGR